MSKTDTGGKAGETVVSMPVEKAIQARQAPQKAFTGAVRYSRFVMVMKLVLPLTAFAVVVLTVFLGTSYETKDELTVTFSASPVPQDDRRMIRPTFTGTSQDGHHFEIMAQTAERDPQSPNQILLSDLSAVLAAQAEETTSETDLRLTAERGRLDTDEQIVTLFDNVSVRSNTGYILRMDRVAIDLDTQSARSESPVEGSGPIGDIASEQVAVSEGWQTVVFSGNVRVTIEPSRLRSPAILEPGKSAPASSGPDTPKLDTPKLDTLGGGGLETDGDDAGGGHGHGAGGTPPAPEKKE